MGKRASKVKQQGMPWYEHRSLKSGTAKFPCLLPAACNLLIHRAGHRRSVDRGGPGPLTTGSTAGRGIARDVWATHRSDPAQVLKVKWTHFLDPQIVQIWIQTLGSFLALCINSIKNVVLAERVMWKNVAFHPSQLKKNPSEQNKGYWVTQWLIIRPTFRCLSFWRWGQVSKDPLETRPYHSFWWMHNFFETTTTTESSLVI